MSAPSAAVIFGVRILFDETLPGFEEMEWGVHPWLKRAKDADLEYRWDKVADTETKSHALFVGAVVVTVGPGRAIGAAVSLEQFEALCRVAAGKLAGAGFVSEFGQPAVWVQWYEDFS